MRSIITLILGLICLNALSQNADALAKSDSLFAKGVELYRQKKYSEAIPFFKESDLIDKVELDSLSNRRDYSATWLASCYFCLGDTITASDFSKFYMLTPIDRRNTVDIDSLQQLAYDCLINKDYNNAISHYTRVLEFYEAHSDITINQLEIASNAYMAGTAYYLQKDFVSALPLFENSFNHYNELKHIECLEEDRLFCCMRLLECLHQGKYFGRIEELSQPFIELYKKLGIKHVTFITPLYIISTVAYDSGNIPMTLESLTEIYDSFRYNHLDGSDDYNEAVSNLGYLYFQVNDYANALPFNKEYYTINCKANGVDDKSNLYILRKISACYFFLSDYGAAIEYEEKALVLAESIFGNLSSEYATSLLNLSQFQNYNGNYAQAIDLINKNLSILKQLGQENTVDYAISISFLANYYNNVGQFQQALELDEVANEIFKNELGPESEHYIRSLDNLALCYSNIGNNAKAYEISSESSKLALKIFGENHADYIRSIANMANYCQTCGKYTEADSLYNKALILIECNIGKNNHQYYTILSNYAGLKSMTGDFDSARQLQHESNNIIKNLLGENHIDYISGLQGLALLNFGHNTNELINLTKEASNLMQCYMRDTFYRLNANERRSLWHSPNFNSWFMVMIPAMDYYYHNECRELGAMDYNSTLFSKNYLLNIEMSISDIISRSKDKELQQLYELLQSNHFTSNEERVLAESKLNSMALKYTDKEHKLIEWQDVKNNLKQNELAIEFRIAPIRNDSIMYCALVLNKETDLPVFVPLFEHNVLKRIPTGDYYKTSELSTLIWKPLENYLNKAESVYFSVDAMFNNIAIENLQHWDKPETMSDLWKLHRLSSTGELAKITASSRTKHGKASLFGGIEYDTSVDLLTRDSRNFSSRGLVYNERSIADSLNLRSGLSYLPATKIEVNEINTLLKTKPIHVELLTDSIATEDCFKDLSGKHSDIIHIATHGFYWTESEARKLSGLDFLNFNNINLSYSDDDKALSRSGLLLAGANNALTGKSLPTNIQDGILTAKEISCLNLSGTDLVVLSACQTGLGEVTGDGVFGLQRGFKKAGANSLLMSLWKVDDRATQMLMAKFYDNLLSGKSKVESLILAQRYVRDFEEEIENADETNMTASQRRRQQIQNETNEASNVKAKVRPFADPKYWAAFILLDALN